MISNKYGKKYNFTNEAPPVINNQNDITKYVECNLICLLKLNYKEGKPFINYEYENIKEIFY